MYFLGISRGISWGISKVSLGVFLRVFLGCNYRGISRVFLGYFSGISRGISRVFLGYLSGYFSGISWGICNEDKDAMRIEAHKTHKFHYGKCRICTVYYV